MNLPIKILIGFLMSTLPLIFVFAQSGESNKYDESFDPLKLNEPRDKFFQEESQQEIRRKLRQESRPLPAQEPDTAEQKPGYRVQLLATPNYQEADSLLSDVREQFEAEARAYLIYDSPNYKIRIGNCESRSEAEELQSVAKQMGYRYAWIVRSTIFPQEKL